MFVVLMTFFVSCEKEITAERLDGTTWEGEASSSLYFGHGGACTAGIAFHGDSTAIVYSYFDGQLVDCAVVNYVLNYPDILFQERDGRYVEDVDDGYFVDSKTLTLRKNLATLTKQKHKIKSIGANGLVGTQWKSFDKDGNKPVIIYFQTSSTAKINAYRFVYPYGDIQEEYEVSYTFDGIIGYFTLDNDHIGFGIIDGKLVSRGGAFNKIG